MLVFKNKHPNIKNVKPNKTLRLLGICIQDFLFWLSDDSNKPVESCFKKSIVVFILAWIISTFLVMVYLLISNIFTLLYVALILIMPSIAGGFFWHVLNMKFEK